MINQLINIISIICIQYQLKRSVTYYIFPLICSCIIERSYYNNFTNTYEILSRNQFVQYWQILRLYDIKSTAIPTKEEVPDNEEDRDNSIKNEEYLSYSSQYEKEKNIVPTLIKVINYPKRFKTCGSKHMLNIFQLTTSSGTRLLNA
ncbi:Hypothetical_protein [Hexamita inflata]|uniref:Hypothetical_protein n=1 Tax=Hexamita inflata TaxID=28002 RepID=A0AA86QEN3_9EUKA|nr:Hypothetical protein HINF_LOCUS43091 [Hexamita inflata]